MRRDLTDLTLAAAVPVAALVTWLAGAPAPVCGGLALLGTLVVLDRLAAGRRLGPADRVLLDAGGLVVVLVLTGTVLGSTRLGLGLDTWVPALVVVALAGLGALAVVALRDDDGGPAERPRAAVGTTLRLLPWLAVAVVLVAVAVRVSTDAQTVADEPPLELAFGEISDSRVEVVVSGGDDVGPLELRTAADGNEVSYPLVDVSGDEATTVTVSLPPTGRYVITLGYPDQTQPLRTLVLDR